MYREQDHIPVAMRFTQRILWRRPNIDTLVAEIEQDPNPLRILLQSFDVTVGDYNASDIHGLPTDLNFLPQAKTTIETLPTIQSMLDAPNKSNTYSFIRGLRMMNPLMIRAENHESEPNIGFHIWEGVSEPERLVGGIFQIYGLTVVSPLRERFESTDQLITTKDILLDALIETMALNRSKHPDDPIFAAVKKLGWFDAQNAVGEYLFSETIRNLAE